MVCKKAKNTNRDVNAKAKQFEKMFKKPEGSVVLFIVCRRKKT
jgi:hypothetical protein